LTQPNGALGVTKFYAASFRIDALSIIKIVFAKVLPKTLWGDKPRFKFGVMNSKFGTTSLGLSRFHKSSSDFDGTTP
jgi:hypothetical protein